MRSKYLDFLKDIIDSTVEKGDIKFVSSEWCRMYCKLTKYEYSTIVKETFYNWNKGE